MSFLRLLPGFLSAFGLMLGTAKAAAGAWSIEAGVARVAVDGIRTYAVPAGKLRQNDTPTATGGYLRVARDVGGAWRLGVAYSRYATLRASGASPDSDIFGRSNISLPVVVPLEMAEHLREISLDGRYVWRLSRRWEISGGPVFSYFRSKAELGSTQFGGTLDGPFRPIYGRIANYTANDLRLGAVVAVDFVVRSNWSTQLGYRFACPPDRNLHLGFVGVRRRF